MTATKFMPLIDVELRSAWPNEAQDFTPWLFENIDFLSEAVGMSLEAREKEKNIQNLFADIVAEDSLSGELVLIENQLESSDEKHLGQIMSYLAGIDAKRVIWVASNFRDPHRSAIRWLNEHTREEYSFFAVRVRAVQIGESPLAPIFEVVEKPNEWERSLREAGVAASELTILRTRFWETYSKKYPDTVGLSRGSTVWVPMFPDKSIVLSLNVGKNFCGMFLRGNLGADNQELIQFFAPHDELLSEHFGENSRAARGVHYGSWRGIALQDEAKWDELIEWMEAKRKEYLEVFSEIEPPSNLSD